MLLGVASLIATPALGAQVYPGVDVSAATVHYDGFLSANALSISPSLVFDGTHGSLAARATVLSFETGHTSVQGALAGATFLRLTDRVHLELSGEGGSSSYRSFAPFVHGVGQLRLHLLTGEATGVWAAGAGGGVHYESVQRGLWIGSMGAWTRVWPALISASVSRAAVGDTAYSDVQANVLWERDALQLTGDAGVRAWSVGGGRGVYGEVSATWWWNRSLALVMSGGRYPADPLRGTIAGRYVALSMRLGRRTPSPLGDRTPRAGGADVLIDPPVPAGQTATSTASASGALGSGGIVSTVTRFDVREAPERGTGMQLLRVVAPRAQVVELMGDFTDWRPVSLTASDDGAWEVTLPIAPGIHRVNVRVDGGAWSAPPGLTVATDDFGGAVGLLPIGDGA